MIGIYQISDRIFDRSYHGLDWSMRSNDSILLISQIGWTPQFFKRPVSEMGAPAPKEKAAVSGNPLSRENPPKTSRERLSRKGCPATIGLGRLVAVGVSAIWNQRNRDQFLRILLAC